jgi:hypothetical protein
MQALINPKLLSLQDAAIDSITKNPVCRNERRADKQKIIKNTNSVFQFHIIYDILTIRRNL